MSWEEAPRSNPFPGLRPFEESDDDLFFGRDVQIDDLVGRLRRHRFIAVVGTSGSGKSSLVRAGLLPALHGGFMARAGSHWRIMTMRPGGAPIANLAGALDSAGFTGPQDVPQDIRTGLARAGLDRGSLGLVELLHESVGAPNENVLILVDQFEELFRFQQDNPNEAAAFVKLLLAASECDVVPVYIVVTMRSDFLGDCARFENLAETINDGLFLVPRMGWDQLRHAIEGPVRMARADIEPALVTRLLNDLGDNPDQLPVLQHALMRTWDLRPDTGAPIVLTLDDYARTGGLKNALSIHGDTVLETLSERDRAVAEKVFQCLTELGNDNRGIRRPKRLGDICAITGASFEDVCRIVGAFRAPGCSFLTPATGVLTNNTVIDIAHEGLMRIWARLRQCVAVEAESARLYRRLADSAELYHQKRARLLTNPELATALAWRTEARPTPAWAERYSSSFARTIGFLDASARSARSKRRFLLTAAGLAATAIVTFLALSFERIEQFNASLPKMRSDILLADDRSYRPSDPTGARLRIAQFLDALVAKHFRPKAIVLDYTFEGCSPKCSAALKIANAKIEKSLKKATSAGIKVYGITMTSMVKDNPRRVQIPDEEYAIYDRLAGSGHALFSSSGNALTYSTCYEAAWTDPGHDAQPVPSAASVKRATPPGKLPSQKISSNMPLRPQVTQDVGLLMYMQYRANQNYLNQQAAYWQSIYRTRRPPPPVWSVAWVALGANASQCVGASVPVPIGVGDPPVEAMSDVDAVARTITQNSFTGSLTPDESAGYVIVGTLKYDRSGLESLAWALSNALGPFTVSHRFILPTIIDPVASATPMR
ncbi:MAG: hypothetical protein ABSH03_17615 [Candidatus Lustribacter sp.]